MIKNIPQSLEKSKLSKVMLHFVPSTGLDPHVLMKFSSSSFILDHSQLLPNLQISMIQHLRGQFQTSNNSYLILMLFTVIKDTKKKKKEDI